jgi:hypothetical protein
MVRFRTICAALVGGFLGLPLPNVIADEPCYVKVLVNGHWVKEWSECPDHPVPPHEGRRNDGDSVSHGKPWVAVPLDAPPKD